MSNDIQLKENVVEKLILQGDLSKLTPDEKVQYYGSMCNHIGIDPVTRPFDYLKLQGKEVLYVNKAGTEQLTKIHKISHEVVNREIFKDVLVVHVRTHKGNQYVDEYGAVTIENLKGDRLANSLMKAITKAKRRGTLSILGLGMLDETEIETIPDAKPVNGNGNNHNGKSSHQPTKSIETKQSENINNNGENGNTNSNPNETAEARKYLSKLIKEKSELALLTKEEVKSFVQRQYDIDDSKKLNKEQLKIVCQWINRLVKARELSLKGGYDNAGFEKLDIEQLTRKIKDIEFMLENKKEQSPSIEKYLQHLEKQPNKDEEKIAAIKELVIWQNNLEISDSDVFAFVKDNYKTEKIDNLSVKQIVDTAMYFNYVDQIGNWAKKLGKENEIPESFNNDLVLVTEFYGKFSKMANKKKKPTPPPDDVSTEEKEEDYIPY